MAAGATVYVVVRHAQKATGDDPPLTAEGEAHARALADALADAGVRALYATPYRRTQATAAPLAERSGVAVTRYEPGDAPATAAAIRAAAHGGTVLVVGHSNTVPALVEALSGVAVPAMPETDYTRMYVVVAGAAGRASGIAAPPIARHAPASARRARRGCGRSAWRGTGARRSSSPGRQREAAMAYVLLREEKMPALGVTCTSFRATRALYFAMQRGAEITPALLNPVIKTMNSKNVPKRFSFEALQAEYAHLVWGTRALKSEKLPPSKAHALSSMMETLKRAGQVSERQHEYLLDIIATCFPKHRS